MLLKNKILVVFLLISISASAQLQKDSTQLDSSRNEERLYGQEPEREQTEQDKLSEILLQKGISIGQIDPSNVQSTRDLIKNTIKDVNNTSGATSAYREEVVSNRFEESVVIDDPRMADDIVRRLKGGATFNEAVTEELAENETSGANEIYGQHIFVNNTIEVYRGSATGNIPGNYVLDAGDEIAINIFGISQADLVYQIDDDGFIRPSNVPKIYLKGVPLTKAKEILTKRFQMAYRYSSEQIAIDLKTARTINVSIFGQVNREGNYTLSALNSVLNALVLADGLKGNGSVRNIRVLSDGKERVIDIYEFLYSGDVKPSYYLKNNDVVYVPIAKNVVTAKGEFRRTGKFELREGEGFKDLMLFTEGLTTNARPENIEILRKGEVDQKILNVDLGDLKAQNYALYDLDIITVAYQDRRLENIVEIKGAVRNAGRFEWREGMRLTDLLKKSEVESFAKLEVGYLVRKLLNGQFRIERIYPEKALANPGGVNDLVLQKEDKVSILNQKDYIHNYSFSIEGAVKRSMMHEWAPFQTLQLSDAVLMAGGLMPNATPFGYIVRKATYNAEKFEYIYIEPQKALENQEDESINIKISPNDRIVIPTIELFNDIMQISIAGGVRRSVTTTYDESLTLQEMVVMAGGLKFEASRSRIDVYRLEFNENKATRTLATSITLEDNITDIGAQKFELMPFDQIVVRNASEYEPIKMVTINGEVKYPGPYAIVGDNYKLVDLITAAGGITGEANLKGGQLYRPMDSAGYVITKMKAAFYRPFSSYNLVLDEGDVITIPRTQSIVHVQTNSTRAAEIYTGAALRPQLNVAYRRGRRAKHYVNNYVGGFAKNTKRSMTVVETKSGRIKKTRNFLLFKVYPKLEPGSTIIAFQKPLKEERKKVRKERRANMSVTERMMQLQAFIMASTTTVTTAVTTILLVRELNKEE